MPWSLPSAFGSIGSGLLNVWRRPHHPAQQEEEHTEEQGNHDATEEEEEAGEQGNHDTHKQHHKQQREGAGKQDARGNKKPRREDGTLCTRRVRPPEGAVTTLLSPDLASCAQRMPCERCQKKRNCYQCKKCALWLCHGKAKSRCFKDHWPSCTPLQSDTILTPPPSKHLQLPDIHDVPGRYQHINDVPDCIGLLEASQYINKCITWERARQEALDLAQQANQTHQEAMQSIQDSNTLAKELHALTNEYALAPADELEGSDASE